MLTTAERVQQVRLCVGKIRRKRERRQITLLSCSCGLQAAGIATSLKRNGVGAVQGMNGSTLMFEDAGGYVLTGVVSFAVAVAITLLCVRWRRKKEDKD